MKAAIAERTESMMAREKRKAASFAASFTSSLRAFFSNSSATILAC